jgi:hypothetical protein
VYYRGDGRITNDRYTTISLPDYASQIASSFTVQVTPIYDGKIKTYNCSRVVDNTFAVYGENGEFNWLVHGLRLPMNVEPLKSEVILKGDGPYTWLDHILPPRL